MKRGKVLTRMLCLAVVLVDISSMGRQVMANELTKEIFAISDVSNDVVQNECDIVDENKVDDTLSLLKNSGDQSSLAGKNIGAEDAISLVKEEDGTENGANPTESGSADGDENNPSEESDGESSSTEEGVDKEQEEERTQDGESESGEAQNTEGEDGERTGAEERGEEIAEETVSENTEIICEELEKDAEIATQGERAVTASGKCGDNLTWTLEAGTLTISGTGEMYDYWMSSNNTGSTQARTTAPWGMYIEEMNTLTINEGVTSIGSSAFYACSNLTGKLSIPNSVKRIGTSAFYNCNGFSGSLIIPNGITKIGGWSFDGCSGFTGDLVIPDSVTEIGDNAFYECSGFSGKLVISTNLTEICYGTFAGCSGFTGNLVIPNFVIKVGDCAFKNCSNFTGDLVIPDNVVEIGRASFVGCSGFSGNLVIGNNVQSIAPEAFEGCNNFLGNLILGNKLQTIGFDAFNDCSGFTGDLLIPDSVTKIEGGTFAQCTGFDGKLVIGNSVSMIGSSAFSGCSGFSGNLIIPDSVTEIGLNAFEYCNGFSGRLTMGNSVQSIGDYAFYGCSGFSGNLVIPDSVLEIGVGAFKWCPGFSGKLILSPNLQKIEREAFFSCDGFTGNLLIPDSVTEINEFAFSHCSGFNGNLSIGNSVQSIGDNAFYGCSGFSGNLIIPDNVVEIGEHAFAGCSNFAGNLKISNNITEIELGTFSNCKSLSGNLQIPNSVAIIGEGAFEGCSGFSGNLRIPNNITSIGRDAFKGCSGFDGNLIISNSIKVIDRAVFANCSGLTGSLTIPDNVTNIEGYAFYGCSGFTGSLIVPSTVTSIGNNAFGRFDFSKKIYWYCTLESYGTNCVDGGTVIYDDDVPKPTYLTNSILIKRSDYEASEGDFPSSIQVPSDKAAIGAIDSATGRLIRSAYIILDGQTYRTDADGVYYFSLVQSSSVKRLIGATADGYLRANAMSISVQHGKLTTVSMTKIVSSTTEAGNIQVPVGKFALCVVDDNDKLIKNAVVEIDGEKITAPDGVFYANADSAPHYVTASAKGYSGYITSPVEFNSGGKFSILLRWMEDYNTTYQVGRLKNADVFSQKISLESGEYTTSDDFDFTKSASLINTTIVLKLRDNIAIDIFTPEECTAVSVSLVPDSSSFIYQDGNFSTDTAKVFVNVHYDYREGFPKNLLSGIEQPKFKMNSIELSIDDGMKVSVEKQNGNYIKIDSSQVMVIGNVYSIEVSVKLSSTSKPTNPSSSYKMTARAIGESKSYAGFQTFRVADADYKSAQTSKRPTAQGSEVSKASVTELLEGNILYNLEGTALEQQYFSKEQIHAIEKILTLWIVNIDAATDTAREISYQEKFVMDVLKKLKVNIKPYLGASETTAQMRIKAETKSYGERTIIFTLNLKNYTWDDKAPFARFGTVEWRVENPKDIPDIYQGDNFGAMITKANTDRFINQLKELAFNSIKDVYSKAWGNRANKVAEMIVDKRILDIVNQEFGSVSDMCFKLMIKPTEDTIKKGGRKKSITKCPVDLYVYDSQGNIAGAIINDIAYPMDDGALVYVEDGAKIVDYYADEYTVKFVGNDSGTMSHEICEYYSTGELIRQIEFNDIPLDDGKVYQETIPDFFFAPPEVYALEEEGQEAIYPDSDSYDEERPEIILVDGISVTPDTASLKIGEEKTLETTITPEEASLKLVEWVSDNENIVTVSDTGIIRAISTGTAKVKAISVDGKFEAECTITVDMFGSDDPTQPDDLPAGILPGDLPSDGVIPDGIWVAGITDTIYTGNAISQSFRLYDKDRRLTEKQDYTVSYKNNKNAYTYTDNDYTAFENNLRNTGKRVKTGGFDPNKAPQVVIKMKGNYSGNQIVYYQIHPMDITASGFKTDNLTVTYSGKKQTPTPTLTWNGKALKYGTDFCIPEYDNAKKDKTAFSASNSYPLTVTGKNNFTGKIPITLTISASGKQIAMDKVNVSGIKALTWTGEQLKPDGYKVRYNKDILSEQNGDYVVSFGENISVGTGTLILTGTGVDTDGDGFSYIGTKTVSFKITGTAMSKVSVSGVKKSYTYTGVSIEPDAVLTYKANKQVPAVALIKDIHYTVTYQKNRDKGTATIIYTGIESNGYTGTKKQTFKIISSNIDNAQGTGSTGKIDVVFKETNRIENGVYIAPYMKGGAKPEVIVTSGGKTLKSGKDYTISYTNNRKVALSTDKKAPAVLIKGKGNYAGSKKVCFSIAAKELSNENGITVKATDKIESPKKNGYRQAFKVYDADGKALGSTDYDSKNVTYTLIQEKNADGTITEKDEMLDKNSVVSAGAVIQITIQGKGIYAGGSATGTYRILEGGHDISKATIQINNQTYTGNPVIITEQGQFKSGKVFIKSGKQTRELILGQDIEVVAGSYVNNTNKGTAKVTFRGINEYGGTKTVSYKIGVRSVGDFWKGVFSNISKLIS